MIGAIRTWLVGITCAAAIVALAESIMPKGTVRKIGRSLGGLVLMVAILQPVLSFDFENLSLVLTQYRSQAEGYSDALSLENSQLMEGIIAEQTRTYIVDKAKELGCAVSAEVSCEMSEEGFPFPAGVTVTGEMSAAAQAQLTRSIEAELAIPAAAQVFVTGKGETP